jgi:uncharacterized protein (TIGR04222 family)
MGEPWGLSGRQFLVVFVVLVLASVVPYAWALLRHRRAAGLVSHGREDLDLYQRAFLVGGPDRVALTALVASSEAERVRVLDTGRVEQVHIQPSPRAGSAGPDLVERALLTAVRAHPEVKAGRLLKILARQGEVTGLAEPLERAGLLMTTQERRRFRARLWPLVLVLGIGGVRFAIGVSLGRPVTFLALLLTGSVVAFFWLAGRAPRRTPAGDAAVRVWSSGVSRTSPSHAVTASPPMLGAAVIAGVAAGVAVLGLPALEGGPLILALRAGGAGSGLGGGDGGGGGGGGGCGGGGCGGGCGG